MMATARYRPGLTLTLVEMRQALRHYLANGETRRANWLADRILELIYPQRWTHREH